MKCPRCNENRTRKVKHIPGLYECVLCEERFQEGEIVEDFDFKIVQEEDGEEE